MVIDEWEYINITLELDENNTLLQSFNVLSDFIKGWQAEGFEVHGRTWQAPSYRFIFKRPIVELSK